MLRRHGDRPRPTVICVHGYRMGWPRLDRAAFQARGLDVEAWYQRGFDIAFFVLPLHGPRSLGWGSGNGFLDGHPLATRDALLRAVAELGSLCAWLHDQGSPALAVTGISLGGLVTSLAASSIPGLRAAIPVMPAVRIGELVWSEARASYRRKARASGQNSSGARCTLEGKVKINPPDPGNITRLSSENPGASSSGIRIEATGIEIEMKASGDHKTPNAG